MEEDDVMNKLQVIDPDTLILRGQDVVWDGGDVCRALGYKPAGGKLRLTSGPRRKAIDAKAFKICGLCSVKNAKIFVAGGSVMSAITGTWAYSYGENSMVIANSAEFSDIDIYIMADTIDIRKRVISELITKLSPTHMVRSEFALTMYISADARELVFDKDKAKIYVNNVDLDRALRKVQVILDPARTMEEVMASYDLDCCCVCTDGGYYYASQRFARAMKTRVNVLREDLKGIDTIKRVAKYFCRGIDSAGLTTVELQRVLTHIDWPREHVAAVLDPTQLRYISEPNETYEAKSIYDSSPVNDYMFLENIVMLAAVDYKDGGHNALRCIGWELGVSRLSPMEFLVAETHEETHLDHWKCRKFGQLCEFYERCVFETPSTVAAKEIFGKGIEKVAVGISTMKLSQMYTITMADLRKKYFA